VAHCACVAPALMLHTGRSAEESPCNELFPLWLHKNERLTCLRRHCTLHPEFLSLSCATPTPREASLSARGVAVGQCSAGCMSTAVHSCYHVRPLDGQHGPASKEGNVPSSNLVHPKHVAVAVARQGRSGMGGMDCAAEGVDLHGHTERAPQRFLQQLA
jgi:hypothetical protein